MHTLSRYLRSGSLPVILVSLACGCGGGPGAGPSRGGAGAGGTNGGSGGGGTMGTLVGDAGANGSTGGGAGSTGPGGTTGAAGASAGDAGAGGTSAGAAGTGSAGVSPSTADGGAAGANGGGDAATARGDFVCTELVALWVASQWWGSFEKGVDTARWEFMFQHHGYLEMFADPASPYWANGVSSKCTTGAATPDRVVFLPFSLSLNTLDLWVTNLTKVVETMKGKFPGVKRIELMTTLRSPGNMPCANDNDPNTVVAPYVDQAIQMVADASGGLVTVGPKIELASCSWWAGGTDLSGAGNTGAGQLLSAYYQTH
jgi:hypothetical protein